MRAGVVKKGIQYLRTVFPLTVQRHQFTQLSKGLALDRLSGKETSPSGNNYQRMAKHPWWLDFCTQQPTDREVEIIIRAYQELLPW